MGFQNHQRQWNSDGGIPGAPVQGLSVAYVVARHLEVPMVFARDLWWSIGVSCVVPMVFLTTKKDEWRYYYEVPKKQRDLGIDWNFLEQY